MKYTELEALEADLSSRGYVKYTNCLSAHESWGWFKSWHNADREITYTIEFRVWDYRQYASKDPYLKESPIYVDVLILDGGGNHRIDLEITSPKFGIAMTEDIAFSLHNMLQPYIEEYDRQAKDNDR